MTSIQWARLSADTFNATLGFYIASMVLYFFYLVTKRERIWLTASVLAWVGLATQLVSVVSRGMASHHVPWGNMFEYSTMLSLFVVAGYLAIIEGRFKVKAVGGFVMMFVVLTMAAAVRFLDKLPPGPLVPALNSYWIKVHVVGAILGSSLFALGSGIMTPLYLWQSRREKKAGQVAAVASGRTVGAETPVGSEGVAAIAGSAAPVMSSSQGGGVLTLDPSDPIDLVGDEDDVSETRPGERAIDPGGGGRLPSAATLDRLAFRTIAFAFPIWTFAIIAGAIWAQAAWGRYWGWDPKETWSFITWVIFAGYLHARATAGWKGKRAAIIALVGFVSLLFTYYAVNLWIVGLHSYAGA
jgi:cytochrome c-type biogenesis protein CcsB